MEDSARVLTIAVVSLAALVRHDGFEFVEQIPFEGGLARKAAVFPRRGVSVNHVVAK